MGRKFVIVLGGLLRWVFTGWYLKRPLRQYLELEDGTEDPRQVWMNIAVVFLALLALVVLSDHILFTNPNEFKPY